MADPVTGGILIGTALLGTAMDTLQSYQQAKSDAAVAKFNAAQDVNAANQATNAAAANMAAKIREGAGVLGEQAAAEGQSNIGTGGSASAVEKQSATNARLDQLNIWYGGELEHENALNAARMERYNQLVAKGNESSALVIGGMKLGTQIALGASASYGGAKGATWGQRLKSGGLAMNGIIPNSGGVF